MSRQYNHVRQERVKKNSGPCFLFPIAIVFIGAQYVKTLATFSSDITFLGSSSDGSNFSIMPVQQRQLRDAAFISRPIMVRLGGEDATIATALWPLPDEMASDDISVRAPSGHNKTDGEPINNHAYPDDCVVLADWHKNFHPMCSPFHELDLSTWIVTQPAMDIVASGNIRSVWRIPDHNRNLLALKTIRYQLEDPFTHSWVEEHRQDAIVHEKLSRSPYIESIYGYCMTSALYDFRNSSLSTLLASTQDVNVLGATRTATPLSDPTACLFPVERIRIVHDVALGLADLHHAQVAMTDVKPDNIVSSNLQHNHYVLSDLNRVRFLRVSQATNESCGVPFRIREGEWRSPEEYRGGLETDKSDVYSLGLVLYVLWTGKRKPYEGLALRRRDVSSYVAQGGLPLFPTKANVDVSNSTTSSGNDDHIACTKHIMVKRIIERCLAYNPAERPSARQLADDLHRVLAAAGESSTSTPY